MKLVKLMNAIVIPFIGMNEVRKEYKSANATIVKFNVVVKISDRPTKTGKLFERCTFFAKNDEDLVTIRDILKENAIVTIVGHEDSFRSKRDNKFYREIIVKALNLISEPIDVVKEVK